MNANFNNLRLGIQSDFNIIVSMLKTCCHDGEIHMDVDQVLDFEPKLDSLRDRLVTLMCVYVDDATNIADQANLSFVESSEQ